MRLKGSPEWYLAIEGLQTGPLRPSDIARKMELGQIDRWTLAWKRGLDDWRPIGEVRQLRYLVGRPETAVTRGPILDECRLAPGAPAHWKPSAVYTLDGLVATELAPLQPPDCPMAGGWAPEPDLDARDEEAGDSILDELAAEEAAIARSVPTVPRQEPASPAVPAEPARWTRSQKLLFTLFIGASLIIILLLSFIAYQLSARQPAAGQQPPQAPPKVAKPGPAETGSADARE